jgi:hypothetical protein
MTPRRSARLLSFGFGVGILTSFAMACVDLFHSTDVSAPPSCDPEASSCVAIDGGREDSFADLCAPDANANAKAVRTCAWLGACLGPVGNSSTGTCIMHAQGAYNCDYNPSVRPRGKVAALWRCLGSVTSCDEVKSCIYGSAVPSCPAEPEVESSTCLMGDGGSSVIACNLLSKPIGALSCTLQGKTCNMLNAARSTCAGGLGAACEGRPRCEGTAAITCRNIDGRGVDEGIDCTDFGSGVCIDDDLGPACAPPPDAGACAIATRSAFACSEDGGVAERCVAGQAVRIHCNALGFTCDPNGLSPSLSVTACKYQGSDAGCLEQEDACLGSRLRSCVNNQPVDIDCRGVGLSGCIERNGSSSCTPPP